MPIRGVRNPFPKKGKPESGIFSSKGKQKFDGGPKNGAGVLDYAHSNTTSKAGSAGSPDKRHQAPNNGKVK